MVVRTAAYRRPGPATAPEAADGSNLTPGGGPRTTGGVPPATSGTPPGSRARGAHDTVTAVSSTTKEVCRLGSSVIVNRTVTVLPRYAVRSNVFWVYVALVPTFE